MGSVRRDSPPHFPVKRRGRIEGRSTIDGKSGKRPQLYNNPYLSTDPRLAYKGFPRQLYCRTLRPVVTLVIKLKQRAVPAGGERGVKKKRRLIIHQKNVSVITTPRSSQSERGRGIDKGVFDFIKMN